MWIRICSAASIYSMTRRIVGIGDAPRGLSYLPRWSVDHEYDLMP